MHKNIQKIIGTAFKGEFYAIILSNKERLC